MSTDSCQNGAQKLQHPKMLLQVWFLHLLLWRGLGILICTFFPGPRSLTWQPPLRTVDLHNHPQLKLLLFLLINVRTCNRKPDYPELLTEEERELEQGQLSGRSICFRRVAAPASSATRETHLSCLLLEKEMVWKENVWKQRVQHTQGLYSPWWAALLCLCGFSSPWSWLVRTRRWHPWGLPAADWELLVPSALQNSALVILTLIST